MTRHQPDPERLDISLGPDDSTSTRACSVRHQPGPARLLDQICRGWSVGVETSLLEVAELAEAVTVRRIMRFCVWSRAKCCARLPWKINEEGVLKKELLAVGILF